MSLMSSISRLSSSLLGIEALSHSSKQGASHFLGMAVIPITAIPIDYISWDCCRVRAVNNTKKTFVANMIRDRSLVYPNRQFGLLAATDSYWNRDWLPLSFNQATPKKLRCLWLIALFFVVGYPTVQQTCRTSIQEGRAKREAFMVCHSMIGVFMIFICIPK